MLTVRWKDLSIYRDHSLKHFWFKKESFINITTVIIINVIIIIIIKTVT